MISPTSMSKSPAAFLTFQTGVHKISRGAAKECSPRRKPWDSSTTDRNKPRGGDRNRSLQREVGIFIYLAQWQSVSQQWLSRTLCSSVPSVVKDSSSPRRSRRLVCRRSLTDRQSLLQIPPAHRTPRSQRINNPPKHSTLRVSTSSHKIPIP